MENIRRILTNRSEYATNFSNNYFPEVIAEVEDSIKNNRVVVVGMAYNPHVKEIRNQLTAAGIDFKYLEYGSYFSGWDKRLAIKMWSGFPTFPQVFRDGQLIGGADVAVQELKDGKFKQ
ncbi:hypothetical protein SAMD00019534_069390 [Acytostelium subglobosum LB1]|uniref:hypothetical protein n=1 Tax=Acytostelium subglobosum LB1 TaxID=1410327 RepID=UPI000644BE2A|nr:hypothetical protein SAMD00019534_069390 [Acytostelium subglobosum LB1]GAM23764.1 hypothetical protein SAMD00019534_069390 [Acytostelium subglobosum LB1]|eukprot:XP_012753505.1 hypothetical protein SAMD00019534_069390 [Acytostelium subglobosum LB1]